jgi:RNA polymerase sigma factor (sigma-70 family)
VAAYLSSVARNALIDWRRRADRFVPLADAPAPGSDRTDDQARHERNASVAAAASGDAPDLALERRQFASALLECVDELESRQRHVWYFRTFFTLRSREIGAHPAVGAQAGHVDVLYSRGRRQIRECMHGKGHSLETIPPGVFVEIWCRFREGIPWVQEGTEPWTAGSAGAAREEGRGTS